MLTLALSECSDSVGKATVIATIAARISDRIRIVRGNNQNLEEGLESRYDRINCCKRRKVIKKIIAK
jgi:hypothetical protein